MRHRLRRVGHDLHLIDDPTPVDTLEPTRLHPRVGEVRQSVATGQQHSADGRHAFLSSANFTERGQQRNVEAGVLIHDAPFAEQLERQWMSLIGDGLTYRYRVDGRGDGEAFSAPRPIVDGGTANEGDAAAAFEAHYLLTGERDALAWLAGQGVPAPDEVGVDQSIDDEVVACLEWRWLEPRIALLVAGTPAKANRTLQEAGWRTITSTDERELQRLVGWLREGRT